MSEKPEYSKNKLNRSFARRIGKGLSQSKHRILEDVLPKYLFNNNKQHVLSSANKVILEIGFGMGDHLVEQMKLNPAATFLGAEVYMNGVAQFLEFAIDAGIITPEDNTNNNLLLWPDDVDLLLDNIPDKSLDIIYILFPDPWPKRKQNKKRLVNAQRLCTFKSKLKAKGQFIFATDISDYFESTYELIDKDKELEFIDKDFSIPHEGYVITKYNKKALRERRVAQFMRAGFISQ